MSTNSCRDVNLLVVIQGTIDIGQRAHECNTETPPDHNGTPAKLVCALYVTLRVTFIDLS